MRKIPMLAPLPLLATILCGCPSTPPDGPTDLTAVATSISSIRLQWTDMADNEIGYNVSRSSSPDGFFAHLATLDADAALYDDVSLESETTYYYRVSAYNYSGASPNIEANATTLAYIGDTIVITAAELNAEALDTGDPAIQLSRGAAITGTVQITVYNSNPSTNVAPLGYTFTWGDRTANFYEVDPWLATGESNYLVDISTTAPASDGVYYLILVCGPEMDVGDLMSCTSWAYGSEVWDDGNDVVDAAPTALAFAVSHGYMNHTVLFSDGTYGIAPRGTAVIRIEVTSE